MPKTSSSSRIRPRRPLKDLPLDRFLDANVPDRPSKRTHSPAGPSLFSPTKRRILEEEGIIVPGGSSARLRVLPVGRDGSSSSPLKKLDFGPPKNSPGARLPSSASTSAIGTPSTRLTRSQTRQSAPLPTVDAFGSSPLPRDGASPNPTPSFQMPRELPAHVDPQSIHYPGFQVHLDPYIVVGPVAGLEADSSPKDTIKENVPPRRRARKSVTAPAALDSKSQLVTPDAKLNLHTPTKSDRSNSATPTARQPPVVLQRDTRLTPKLHDSQRRELRRRLAEEVDMNETEDF